MLDRSIRRCSIYDGHGECCGQSIDLEVRFETGGEARTASDVPLREIMTLDVVCARPDLEIDAAVALMIHHHIGCLPIVDERRRPVGVITKYDIIEQLDACLRSDNGTPPADLGARTAGELMMPLAMTLGENATIAHAAALMTADDLHHIIVIDELARLVGIVTTKDVTRWIATSDKVV